MDFHISLAILLLIISPKSFAVIILIPIFTILVAKIQRNTQDSKRYQIFLQNTQDTENSQYGNCSYQLDFLILSRILGLAKINVN